MEIISFMDSSDSYISGSYDFAVVARWIAPVGVNACALRRRAEASPRAIRHPHKSTPISKPQANWELPE